MHNGRITFTRYTIDHEHRHPGASGEFSGLLNSIATSIKMIALQVAKGPLAGNLGNAGADGNSINVQGEVQKKLDVICNDVMIQGNDWTGHLTGMASEEMEQHMPIVNEQGRGKYLLVFDPLDGSSNIDVNLTVGTIFSILRAPVQGVPAKLEDFLRPGTEQVCAGFALYGASTTLVLTTGAGVDGFTLDRDIGAFVLTHPQMRVPEDTREFAINASNERFWEPPVKRYVTECLAGVTGPRGKDFNMRWIASLVAETFRILTRGGIFMYPRDTKDPSKPGRLRLLYEANPIAFIIEQAGGAASTGRGRILDVVPTGLHQRVPLIFGSRNEVAQVDRYHDDYINGRDAEGFDSPLFGTRSLFRNQAG